MFNVRLDTTICELRRALCPPSRPNQDGSYDGIVFTALLDLSLPTPEKVFDQIRVAHVVLCGNTNVFLCVREEKMEKNPLSTTLKEWENTCNHDVCWRSDGLRPLTDLYFGLAGALVEEAGVEKAHKDLNDNSRLGFLHLPPFQLVTVRHKLRPNEHYERELVSLEGRK